MKVAHASGSGTQALLPSGTYRLWNWGAHWTTGTRTGAARLFIFTATETLDSLNLAAEVASNRIAGVLVHGIVTVGWKLTVTHPINPYVVYTVP